MSFSHNTPSKDVERCIHGVGTDSPNQCNRDFNNLGSSVAQIMISERLR